MALLVALHKYSLSRSRACRRVQRFNLAAYPFSGKDRTKSKMMDFPTAVDVKVLRARKEFRMPLVP